MRQSEFRRTILSRRIEEVRASRFFGVRKPRTFREAATKFLEENQHKRSLERDARALAVLDPYIGKLTIQQVHYGTLHTFIHESLNAGKSPGTINRDLAVARRILNLCARLWLLFSELAGHLARMALFKVNTGTREHEVCSLRWSWSS